MQPSTSRTMEESEQIPIAARFTGPGPGAYRLPPTVGYRDHDASKRKAPAWKIAHPERALDRGIPGPYMYDSTLTHEGRQGGPRYSMLGRAETFPQRTTTQENPAPGTYRMEEVYSTGQRGPKHSFGTTLPPRDNGHPGPNHYTLPNVFGTNAVGRSVPNHSVVPRRLYVGSYFEDLAKTPGPANYQVPGSSVVHRGGPSYSLGPRTQPPDYSMEVPAANHYPMHPPRPNPAYTMGIRHSRYTMPLYGEREEQLREVKFATKPKVGENKLYVNKTRRNN